MTMPIRNKIMVRNEIKVQNAVSVGPYSQGIDTGDLIFLSGQTPLDPGTGKLVDGGIREQTEQGLKNLFNVLKAAGLNSDNVLKVNIYLTDMKDFPEVNAVYKDHFSEPYPARTTIGVAALPLGARIEIEMIAKR